MRVLGRELPALDFPNDLGWFLPGPVPDGEVRNTACELAIPSMMPSAISEGIIHAALAQRSRLTRAGDGRAIFLRTEACLARRQGSPIESRGLAGACCKSRCMATIASG